MKITKYFSFLTFVFIFSFLLFSVPTYAKKSPQTKKPSQTKKTPNKKKTAYMKKANVRWNLKPDKEISFKTYFDGYEDYISIKAKVKDFKIEDAEKEGFKKASFTIDYKFPKLDLTREQVKRIYDERGSFHYMWTVLDYNTGTSLEVENDSKVKVEYSKWIYPYENHTYKIDDDSKLSIHEGAKKEVTITYPENYKRLVLMVGGATDPHFDGSLFWDGNLPLMKTAFYEKKKKDLSSFMRIK